MSNDIYCYLNTCVHNHDRSCEKKMVSIANRTSSEFCCGERVCYAVCEDYEELEKDGTD